MMRSMHFSSSKARDERTLTNRHPDCQSNGHIKRKEIRRNTSDRPARPNEATRCEKVVPSSAPGPQAGLSSIWKCCTMDVFGIENSNIPSTSVTVSFEESASKGKSMDRKSWSTQCSV